MEYRLILAAESGDAETVKSLLNKGVFIHTHDIAQILIKAGAK